MAIITRRLEFDAGHRVLGHGGKCRHLHGHRYRAEITVASHQLDGLGMVTDFSVIKEKMGDWIDKHWDHNLLLNSRDPLIDAIRKLNPEHPVPHEVVDWSEIVFAGKAPYVFDDRNPTAENMADVLFHMAVQLIEKDSDLLIENVRLYETPNCWADRTRSQSR